jgi:hypothetical protein
MKKSPRLETTGCINASRSSYRRVGNSYARTSSREAPAGGYLEIWLKLHHTARSASAVRCRPVSEHTGPEKDGSAGGGRQIDRRIPSHHLQADRGGS